MSGSGGGDDGYEKRQREMEQRKQTARDSLNRLFGVGGSTVTPREVDRNDFFRTSTGQKAPKSGYLTMQDLGEYHEPGAGMVTPRSARVFDQNAYNAALNKAKADAQAEKDKVEANKTARDTLYQTVRDNAFTAGKRRLDEDREDAARKLKFELFATGNAGGSQDIDQNARLGRTYSEGLMDLGAKADSAKADFRANDEKTRLQLLQSIDAGMDQGSALSSAASQMQIAADQAAASANGTALGDLFNTGSEFYNQSQYAKGREAGQEWWNTYGSRGGRGTGRSSATGATSKTEF